MVEQDAVAPTCSLMTRVILKSGSGEQRLLRDQQLLIVMVTLTYIDPNCAYEYCQVCSALEKITRLKAVSVEAVNGGSKIKA